MKKYLLLAIIVLVYMLDFMGHFVLSAMCYSTAESLFIYYFLYMAF